MSEMQTAPDRDAKTGRFLTGGKAGPGRPPGSRNRLSEDFVRDLAAAWSEFGVEALKRTATEEPAVFVRTIAQLLPRDLNLNVGLDVTGFAQSFALACATLRVEQPARRRVLPAQKVIDHVPQRR